MIEQHISSIGAIFGALAVIFGAFGAHRLKKIYTPELLANFETGVKYQMYHAITLLVLGNTHFAQQLIPAFWCFSIGIVLFSFSIYGLCWSSAKDKKWRFLGPITPIGGLLLVIGWVWVAKVFW